MLRNSLNSILIKYYGDKWYKMDILSNHHKEKLNDVYKVLKENKKEINLNNIKLSAKLC